MRRRCVSVWMKNLKEEENNWNTNWFRLEDVATIFNWNTTSERFVNVMNCHTCCWRAAAAAALSPNLSINNNALKWINQSNMLPPSALHVLLWINGLRNIFTVKNRRRSTERTAKKTVNRRNVGEGFQFSSSAARMIITIIIYICFIFSLSLLFSVCRSVCVPPQNQIRNIIKIWYLDWMALKIRWSTIFTSALFWPYILYIFMSILSEAIESFCVCMFFFDCSFWSAKRRKHDVRLSMAWLSRLNGLERHTHTRDRQRVFSSAISLAPSSSEHEHCGNEWIYGPFPKR